MIQLQKYGTQCTILFPLVKAGSNNFAVSGDYTHASGDVKISKDGGAAATATNAPSAITMGNGAVWSLTLTATEMQAAEIVVTIIDAATKAVEDQAIVIHTHGNASAKIVADLSVANLAANVTQFGGTNATTSGGRPEVNLSHIAGSAVSTSSAQLGVNVVNFGGSAGTFASGRPEVNTSHIAGSAVSTTSAQIGVNVVNAGGTAWGSGAITAASIAAAALNGKGDWSTYAGGDTSGTTTLLTRLSATRAGYLDNLSGGAVALASALPANFSALAITVGGSVTAGTVSDKTGYSLTQSFPSNFASLGINASGHVSRVTLCDTTTTNTDMRGTDGAALASAWTSTRAGYLDAVPQAANANQRTVQITGSQHIAADIHELQTGVIAAADFAAGAIDAAALASDAATEIAAAVAAIDIDGKTLQAALRIVAAIVGGVASGAGTSTEVFKGLDGSTTRATVTADTSGNRTAVTYA